MCDFGTGKLKEEKTGPGTFTPGPWEDDAKDHTGPNEDIKIRSTGGRNVCLLWIDDAPVREFNAEQWANARLIRMAPELLEELETAVTFFRQMGYQDNGPLLAPMIRVINQARGCS